MTNATKAFTLPVLTEKERTRVLAIEQAKKLLKAYDRTPYELWRNISILDNEIKKAQLNSFYDYRRDAIVIDCCFWSDGSGENEKIVLVFNAPYCGQDNHECPWNYAHQAHTVWYYVGENGKLEWANEDGEPNPYA
jgi:hypothetical protein